MISEIEQMHLSTLHDLQQTAMEQDLLDGGDGQAVYVYTMEDVYDSLRAHDWGTEVYQNDNSVRKLFNKATD